MDRRTLSKWVVSKGESERCVGNNPLIYISIVMNDVEKCVELKEKCRKIFNIGKHSFHMSDYNN